MSDYSDRLIAVYELPLNDNLAILRTEQAVLRFENGNSVDIGALCYLRRERFQGLGKGRKGAFGRRVVLSSFCSQRRIRIQAFIEYLSGEAKHGSRRPSTLCNYATEFASFLNWADESGFSDAISSPVEARRAIESYVSYLKDRVRSRAVSLNTAATSQNLAITAISEFLDIEGLARGISLLSKDRAANQPTVPPSEKDQGRALALCETLFDALSTHVLDGNTYPFAIRLPDYLGYPENQMWVLPTHAWCVPASHRAEGNRKPQPGAGYNYLHGRLSTREEILSVEKYKPEAKRKIVNQILVKSKLQLDLANQNTRHPQRIYLAMFALNVFVPMFLSRTGMNWAQMAALHWTGNYKENSSTIRQRFREIKFRAGNKEVSFQLPLQFTSTFKRFLQLRDYLLEGNSSFEHLFFSKGEHGSKAPKPITENMGLTFKALRRIDPGLSPILPMAWRAAKSDWSLTRTDVATTALLLQNSEQSVRQSYAAGSVATHLEEMSDFLGQMVLDGRVETSGFEETAVGECSSYGDSQEISGGRAAVLPDCQRPEIGCLFCNKLKIHADEHDVRKLLSCRYCLRQTSHLSGFHSMAEPLLARIELILTEVRRRDEALVDQIEQEVDEGEMDVYWAAKYDMLLRLKLVNESI